MVMPWIYPWAKTIMNDGQTIDDKLDLQRGKESLSKDGFASISCIKESSSAKNARENSLNVFKRLDESLLLSPKIMYFITSATYYTLYLFRPKFITGYLGLNHQQYGDISGVMGLVGFIGMTVWSSLADSLGRPRLVLACLCLATLLTFTLFSLVVEVESQEVRFYLSIILFGLYGGMISGLFPLVDHLTLKILTDTPGLNSDLYSRQCLFGTISYGATSLLVGWSIKKFGLSTLFYLIPITSLSCIMTLYGLRLGKSMEEQSTFVKSKSTSMEGLNNFASDKDECSIQTCNNNNGDDENPMMNLLNNYNFIFILSLVFIIGCTRAVMTTFLGKYWLDEMKLDDGQVGIAANFGIIMEIIIFYVGPKCIHSFGVYWMLLMAQLAIVIRTWAYVIIPSEQGYFWIVYLVELLKGVSFGFTQISGTKLAANAAPLGLEATAQALYSAFYSQLPIVITAFIGGRFYQVYGPSLLFIITALIASIALFISIGRYFWDGKLSQRESIIISMG